MPSSDLDHNYYTLPVQRPSSRQPSLDPVPPLAVDSGAEGTRFYSSSPPPPPDRRAASPPFDYTPTRTPQTTPQRPVISTNLNSFTSNAHFNGVVASSTREDNSPDPHEFYRQFHDPFRSKASALPLETDPFGGDLDDDMTTSSYQRKTAASAARSQPVTSKYPTYSPRNGASRPTYRSSSVSSDATSPVNGAKSTSTLSSSRLRQPSLKDLVNRFNQASEESQPLAPKLTPRSQSRNASANNASFLRSRTPSGTAPALQTMSSAPERSTKPAKQMRRKPTNDDLDLTIPSSQKRTDEWAGHAITSNQSASQSLSDLAMPPKEPARKPLFGEVLSVVPGMSDAGYGIPGHTRRGSDSSIYSPGSSRHDRGERNQGLSPSSPTAWYLGVAPSLDNVNSKHGGQDGGRGHRRARSDFAANASVSANSAGHAAFMATISPPPPEAASPTIVKRSAHSKIPLSTQRRRSPSESGTSPPSTRASSALGAPVAKFISPPRGQSAIPRPTTPPRSTPRRPDASPNRDSGPSPSLKAYITAPMPKKSPPLRSSRPRLPVSSASSSAAPRVKVADKFSPQQSREHSRTREGKPRPKRLPELGGVDFAARRERIQRAFTKSVRESEEKKQEIQRKRLTRLAENQQRQQQMHETQIKELEPDGVAQTTDHQPDEAKQSESGKAREVRNETTADLADPPATPEIHLFLEDSPVADKPLTLDTLLPSMRYADDSQPSRQFGSPDSPTLGMPGGFPSPDVERVHVPLTHEDNTTSTATAATPIEDEPQTEKKSLEPPPSPAPRRTILSQIMQMRQSDLPSPSRTDGECDDASNRDDTESIQIMLGATPVANDYDEGGNPYPWDARPEDFGARGDRPRGSWSTASFESPRDRQSYDRFQFSMERISENSPPLNKKDEPLFSYEDRFSADKGQVMGKAGHDTMDSETYSTINKVLEQYHAPYPVSSEMLQSFQQKMLTQSPELARQGGWDPKRVTQLYLQELAKGKARSEKQEPTVSTIETNVHQHHEDVDARGYHQEPVTPVTDIDYEGLDDGAGEHPRGYQLSDGGWSSHRASRDIDDSADTGSREEENIQQDNDWDMASSSATDWIHPRVRQTPTLDEPDPDYRPPPPPKDHESPQKPLAQSRLSPIPALDREGADTPRINTDDRPRLPEIKSAGEGLGLSLSIDPPEDSPTLPPPLPDHSPPLPPAPETIESTVSAPVPPPTQPFIPPSPSIYSRNPPSSIFPSVFPRGIAEGPSMVRIGDGSSQSAETPTGSAIRTPETGTSQSQEQSSHELPSRQSSEGQVKDAAPSAEQKRLTKRKFIIKELVDTEKSFLQDMTVTDEIYKGTASPPLRSDDIKTLFWNSDQIVAFSKTFLEALKQASSSVYVPPSGLQSKRTSVATSDSGGNRSSMHNTDLTEDEKDKKTFIGEAFGQHMARMEKVYGEYLRNHGAANRLLEKIQNLPNVAIWLQQCRENAYDLTAAWSLDSLLVKPVQRILKYPLLLSNLLEVTPENHPDFTALDVAVREMTGASHRIDEMKKRADVLEKVVGRKRKESDVRTGISKAFGRRTEKLRQQVGLSDMFEDRAYGEIQRKFGSHLMHLHLVMKDVESYTADADTYVQRFNQYVVAIEAILQVSPSSYPEVESKWRKFAQSMREMSVTALNEHKLSVRKHVIEPMVTLLKIHDGPQKIMAKRNKRILDYAKYRGMKDRGDKPDKKITEQGEQFVALNDTLKDELPRLFNLTTKLVEACLQRFVSIQMQWQTLWQTKLKAILDEPDVPNRLSQIIVRFVDDFELTQAQVASLGICNGQLLAEAVNFLSPSITLSDERDRSNSLSRPPTLNSRHRTGSMNSDQSPSLPTPDFAKRNSGSFFTPFGDLNPPYPPPTSHSSTGGHQQTSSTSSANGSAALAAGRLRASSGPRPSLTSTDATTLNSIRSYSYATASTRPSTSAAPGINARSPTQPGPFFSPQVGTQRPPTPTSNTYTNLFTSALPLSDSPVPSPTANMPPGAYPQSLTPTSSSTPGPTPGPSIPGPNVMFLAASLFEFNIDRARKEAGYPYLTYVPGEIFDVIGEKGELWLAKNQDDPGNLVGWIWCKHFARLDGGADN